MRCLGMRRSVACSACREHGVFSPVAERACEILMLGGGLGHQVTDFFMAWCTESP